MALIDAAQDDKTGLGNYFVSNYPPFSAWKSENLPNVYDALQQPFEADTPFGLYLHIPFCRKRCKFCYFRVYTDKNARDVETYLNALYKEIELYSEQPLVANRPIHYVYFGGGTPSYLSASQLRAMAERLRAILPWSEAKEITFECEPGTLQEHKLEALHDLGITRLSLGIENFNDDILQRNGRAHLSAEIHRAYGWARKLNFNQINIDLISGMVGETWDNWRDCVTKTIEMAAESVTIYQMELPFNTEFSKEMLDSSNVDSPVADWPTKRAWVQYAFDELANAGYEQSSAYTMVRDKKKTQFLYRDCLWHGADMLGTGVASFGHIRGVHVQNIDKWETYVETLQRGELPLGRALTVSSRQLMLREMMLQLKTGRLDPSYFQEKFSINIMDEFAATYGELQDEGYAKTTPDSVELTADGFLVVDRLLYNFFEPEYLGKRYT